MGIYQFVGILGLIIVAIGVFWQKKFVEDMLYMIGGAALLVYSYYIKEWIFIIFTIVFVLSALFHFIRTMKPKKEIKLETNQKSYE